MLLDEAQVKQFYKDYAQKVADVKKVLNRPLTYAEKILYTHLLLDPTEPQRGKTSVPLRVDRVAMQDATAQMAILQFMNTGKSKVAVPTTVHCDHLIRAQTGASEDLKRAQLENDEVYAMLKSSANKYGMGFWEPGAGIIHQVVLENYAQPGALMIGTDSHTPNAGGLGMVAIGVGGADAVDAMAGEPWTVRFPKLIGVHLKGKLSGWSAPKDIILKVAQLLTVKGGTGYIVEYFGEGARTFSCTGKGTITNMGAEIGATTSLFPYDTNSSTYLRATQRAVVADCADSCAQELCADQEVESNPEKFFDQVIEINLSELVPQIVGPHTPDLGRSVADIGDECKREGWHTDLKYTLIGSCTNSSYEDMQRAAAVAQQALKHGAKVKCGFLVTPGSAQIFETIKRDGLLEVFEKIGATVLANACGPCIGQWKRTDIDQGDKNSILTSYNRNFKKRNDANPETCAFIGSPEIVTAYALAGTLDFNPLTDEIQGENGSWKLEEPPVVDALPTEGFVFDQSGYHEPTGDGEVSIDPQSNRLALLEPFTPLKADDLKELVVLFKAKGKCTTDHISPAGKWLLYRGHLDNICGNMYSGAVNSWSEEPGTGKNVLTNEVKELTAIARDYKEAHQGWVVIGDENIGEGSSREHAAMEPRHLGCRIVIARSFARIHETNLKRQGLLALTFAQPQDYEKVQQNDRISIEDLTLEPGKSITVTLTHEDGSQDTFETTHTLTHTQIEWFNAGSALNYLAQR